MSLLGGGMDRLLTDVFENVGPSAVIGRFSRETIPPVNLWEDDSDLYAEMEVPGLKMEDIEVSVLGDELTIKGKRENVDQEGVSYHRRERSVGTFSRMLRLPVDVDVEKVHATLRDGVLTITLPKAAAARPQKIEVNLASNYTPGQTGRQLN